MWQSSAWPEIETYTRSCICQRWQDGFNTRSWRQGTSKAISRNDIQLVWVWSFKSNCRMWRQRNRNHLNVNVSICQGDCHLRWRIRTRMIFFASTWSSFLKVTSTCKCLWHETQRSSSRGSPKLAVRWWASVKLEMSETAMRTVPGWVYIDSSVTEIELAVGLVMYALEDSVWQLIACLAAWICNYQSSAELDCESTYRHFRPPKVQHPRWECQMLFSTGIYLTADANEFTT